jgi:hypothetical protein
MIPYEDIYGQNHMSMASHIPRTTNVHAIDKTLHTKEAIICILKINFIMAEN